MNHTLYQRLMPVVRRIRFRRTMLALAVVWLGFAMVAAAMFALNQYEQVEVGQLWLPLVLVATFVTVLVAIICLRSNDDFYAAVRYLEQRFPDLDHGLLTASEQRSQPGKPMGFLQQDVVRQAINHSFSHDWRSLIPGWQLLAAPIAGFVGLFALCGTLLMLVFLEKPIPVDPTLQFSDVAVDNVNYVLSVEPGNAEVERNTSLLVLARFADAIPPDSTLVYEDEAGELRRMMMNKSLDDPVFGVRIPFIKQATRYWIEYAEQASPEYKISVFDYPAMIRADAELDFPEYTGLKNKIVQDVRRLSAVEKTEVLLSVYVNKQLASARLVAAGNREKDQPGIELQSSDDDDRKWTMSMALIESGKYEVELTDNDGRKNRIPPSLIFKVLQNQLPDLKLQSPRRDVQVSPIEELQLIASAWDDFGLNAVGLSFEVPGGQNLELALLKDAAARKRHQLEYLLEFENLEAEPDQLLSYYFWAEDLGPDGQPRRVQSDMYFAEVRHFEEIFRQGQQPPGGAAPGQQPSQGQSGQNAQQAQQLAELQKQIINATWKLVRTHSGKQLGETFFDDVRLIRDSQQQAVVQLEEALSQVEDETSLGHVEQVRVFMNEAIVHLGDSVAQQEVDPLDPALASEKSAYQALLKLRAREHEVVRQQQQQQSQSSQQQNNRSQQQLQQLNLDRDENPYQQERTAEQQQQQTEEREDRQVLSRLRELARRQEDLNDRIKELQSALEKAETEQEREEIEDRLKSLREQQEQLLRDTDELIERMQSPENQQRMSEEAQQLEQARENIREASESLDQGQVSQAAAEGTRAERELEELRDEFQNRTAGRFNERMREMRNEAQDLEREQDSISEELNPSPLQAAAQPEDRTPSLRDDEGGDPDLSQRLADQQQRVEQLRQRMRETIEDAEEFEPLLAEELYETYRETERSRPDQSLESARQSLERGWNDDAREQEQQARQGISEMRQGIEQAAENVLGDETEALRAAERTLQNLNQQLRDEISRQQGESSDEGQSEGQPREPENAQQRFPAAGENERQQSGEGQQPGERQPTGEGQQPNEREDRQPGQAQNPGQQDSGQPTDDQPNQSNSPGSQAQQSQSDSDQPGRSQGTPPSEDGNQSQPEGGGGRDAESNPDNRAEEYRRGQNPEQPGSNPDRLPRGGNDDGRRWLGGQEFWTGGGGNQITMERIFGNDFREFSDQLRDVEEMIADPELRSEAARIREEARKIRIEQKRHSAEPNWDLVKLKVAQPLVQLQDRVAEELLRRTSRNAMIPLDRDPVPAEYQDDVRRYYERIGRGE